MVRIIHKHLMTFFIQIRSYTGKPKRNTFRGVTKKPITGRIYQENLHFTFFICLFLIAFINSATVFVAQTSQENFDAISLAKLDITVIFGSVTVMGARIGSG